MKRRVLADLISILLPRPPGSANTKPSSIHVTLGKGGITALFGKKMRALFTALLLTALLSTWVRAQDTVPAAVQRILEQIPKIKRGDTMGEFLQRTKITIDKDAEIIGGMSSLGEDGYVWRIGDSGQWIMCTTSHRGINEKDGGLKGEFEDGDMVGVRIYYREKVTEEIDYNQMKKQTPYLEAHKLYTGADQPADAPDSKPQGSEKPQPESKPAPR